MQSAVGTMQKGTGPLLKFYNTSSDGPVSKKQGAQVS